MRFARLRHLSPTGPQRPGANAANRSDSLHFRHIESTSYGLIDLNAKGCHAARRDGHSGPDANPQAGVEAGFQSPQYPTDGRIIPTPGIIENGTIIQAGHLTNRQRLPVVRRGHAGKEHRPGRASSPLAALLVAVLLAACSSQAAPGDEVPPQVSVAAVLSEQVRQWDGFTGRVAAVETVDVRPRVSGYVERVAFAEGRPVRKGDLLFAIDPRPYRAALQRAQAELARARSEAQLANAQNVRAKALVEAKVISREEFETRSAATAQGDAMERAAEAAVASARLDLQFTEVRSPIDGLAGRALVTVGNLAQADASVLTTVVSQDPVHVHFEADERTWLRYAQLARNGERATTQNAVRVGLAGDTGHPHEGIVDFIDNRIDPATGTIRARALLRNPDGVLTPGLFARVQLEGSGAFQALLIDAKAVLTDQDRQYVYVLGEGDTAQRRDVVLGPVIDGLRVVEQGLAPGDRVIVNGVQRVFMSGMPVAPQTVDMRRANAARVASAGTR